MVTKRAIDDFFLQKHLAIAGVSGKKKSTYGNVVFRELTAKGFTVYPVNPNAAEAEGVKCYPDAVSLPDEVTAILITVPKTQSEKVVKDAENKGIKHIWIQQMSDTPQAIEAGKKEGVNLIYKKCVMMFAQPVKGIHKFHRGIMSFFGRLPK